MTLSLWAPPGPDLREAERIRRAHALWNEYYAAVPLEKRWRNIERVVVLDAVDRLEWDQGRTAAVCRVADLFGVSRSTIWRWRDAVAGYEPRLWEPVLGLSVGVRRRLPRRRRRAA